MEAQVATKQSKALTPEQKQASNLYNLLMTRKDGIAALLPKHLTPEKLVRGFMAQSTRNKRLLECTPASVLNTVLIAANLGLELGRQRGGIHPVPFKNGRTGKYECTPIPDYRGLMDLAYRSGRVLSIEARVVYENDKFDFAYGTESHVSHVPNLKDRGAIKCFYVVAHLKDARPAFVVLSPEDVNESRDRSKSYQGAEKSWGGKPASKDSPWHTDYPIMALKTGVKRLTNWLPQSSEFSAVHKAVELDDRMETGDDLAGLFDDVIETTAEEVVEETTEQTRSGALKEKLAAKTPAPATTTDGAEQNHGDGGGDQSSGDEGPSPYEKFLARVEEQGDAETLNAFFNSTEAAGYLNAMEKQTQEFAKTAYRKKRDSFKPKK